MRRLGSIATAALIAAALAAGSASAAPPATKSASSQLAITVDAGGRCHATATSTWTGYPVWEVEVQFRADGSSADGWHTLAWSLSNTSSPVVLTAVPAARPGSVWTAHVVFMSRHGVYFAEIDPNAVTAPASCVYP